MKPFVVGDEAYPGKKVKTDADIEDAIRKSFNTIYHGSCTCASKFGLTPFLAEVGT
jgi:choline dehydrogenase